MPGRQALRDHWSSSAACRLRFGAASIDTASEAPWTVTPPACESHSGAFKAAGSPWGRSSLHTGHNTGGTAASESGRRRLVALRGRPLCSGKRVRAADAGQVDANSAPAPSSALFQGSSAPCTGAGGSRIPGSSEIGYSQWVPDLLGAGSRSAFCRCGSRSSSSTEG
jgi:hypothetical protein